MQFRPAPPDNQQRRRISRVCPNGGRVGTELAKVAAAGQFVNPERNANTMNTNVIAKRILLASVLSLALSEMAAGGEIRWRQLGRAGDWQGTVAAAVINDWLYTIDANGGLYRTHPYTGQWSQVGGLDFANTRFMFALGGSLYTIETDGSLYRVSAGNGAWEQIGQPGAWLNTIAGAAWPFDARDGVLLTVESNGGLYSTRPADGSWVQVGVNEFGNTRFMWMAGSMLYTIEADGGLYEVDPVQGRWQRVGNAGEWRGTLAGAVLNDRLYTAEENGGLFETHPATGDWKQLGKPEYGNTAFMLAAAGGLYTIEADGSLYRSDLDATESPSASQPLKPHIVSQSTLNITPLGNDRFRAEISYLDQHGETKTGSTDGTRDEIRSWLNGLSDLPADSLNNFLRGVEQAGQRRIPPRRSVPPLRG